MRLDWQKVAHSRLWGLSLPQLAYSLGFVEKLLSLVPHPRATLGGFF